MGESGARHFEHGLAEIKARRDKAGLREPKGDIAGATTQVERAPARRRAGQANQAPFPAPMQAQALQVVA